MSVCDNNNQFRNKLIKNDVVIKILLLSLQAETIINDRIMMAGMKKLTIFAQSEWLMEIGQRVRISPYLTHLNDWVMGVIIEVEENPYRGTVIAAKDTMGRIFWGEQDYFDLVNA